MLMLDTGSEIHLTPTINTVGLTDVAPLTNPARVKGVGAAPTLIKLKGFFLGMPMYVGTGPCVIISLGVCLDHGGYARASLDFSCVRIYMPGPQLLSFDRQGSFWLASMDSIGRRSDHLRPTRVLITQEEAKLEFSARQLKQAEVARLHTKRLGFPGIGTLRGIVHGATVKDLPVASEGIRVQMKIVGTDPASEKGGWPSQV